MKKRYYKVSRIGVIGMVIPFVVAAGCTPVQTLQRTKSVTLPSSFNGTTDTTSMADISWKNFFKDTYLIHLIDTALQQNWDLLSAVQRVEMVRSYYQQSRGALKPFVQGIAAAGADKFGDYTMNGVGNFDTNLSGNIDKEQEIPTPVTPDYFLGLRSSWEIDLWGKLKNRRSAAYHRLRSSQKELQFITTLLVAEVASQYYELLALDNELAIARKNIQLQQEAVDVVKVQKEAGRATELAVQQFTAQLLRTKSLETDLLQRITATENNLNMLLGRFPQPISRSRFIPDPKLPGAIRTGVPAAMLLRRPDIQQAELELGATEADVAAARAAFLPSLTISPYVAFNAFSAATLFNPGSIAYGVLGGLAGPLLNRSAVKGEYNRSLAASQQAFYNYQKIIMDGYREVATDLNRITNLQKKYTLKEQEAKVLEEAISSANTLYLAGRATYLEVITAQKSVVEAELDLIDTKKEMFFALINLYRALGGGWK